ncbi:MAG: pyruvate dehydrogenase (acetyl-transferring), homodimeric type [Planctomycetes bacterium]|nr:pyruvate dehydrogenase (acetyl-transferring), homodimeric type [Planctomycetota bacterium]
MSEYQDIDPQETREWLEALQAIVDRDGIDRARHIMTELIRSARRNGAYPPGMLNTDYVNTIPAKKDAIYPGDFELERRIRRICRWNAAVMVARSNTNFPGLGGHMSTYASAATLYDVGFNHFFRGKDHPSGGDIIYFQGHASPGFYARSFLEGRISADQLEHFRRESQRGQGLSSYPHPRLMPGYWEFPTVSMGLGPISAIYQARFLRYLHARGIKDTSDQRVWCFMGDGESDEPESLGSLSIAAREKLDNLHFVINCNLQRLDGPVRGNGKIIQELERVFRGNGWKVIKVIWGRDWDPIFARDTEGALVKALNEVVDGEWQKYGSEPGSYTRKEFFERDPRLAATVAEVPDDQILRLRRGGHDPVKLYTAYREAVRTKGQPVVILVHTVKGWTLGEGFEASNVTHQMKKLTFDQLKRFRDRLHLPIKDEEIMEARYYHPGPDSDESRYLRMCREALGGYIPERRSQIDVPFTPPKDEVYAEFDKGTGEGRGVSTTMAFVRLLSKLLKDKEMGRYIVPIVPDEARTFGMDSLFRQVGIYAEGGQRYEPIDRNMLLYYREAKDGQLLEEGITEAGAMSDFIAAGTAYATHGKPMIPFYVFYSMFGFQRIGDLIWMFGDMRGRGFLLGATAGRTTLNGEGLQHEDGHSHLLASTVPNIAAYDPAFAYEVAAIVKDGIKRMYVDEEDIFYYLTLQNENYDMPAMPAGYDVTEGILKGLYLLQKGPTKKKLKAQIFASACTVLMARKAQEILAERYDVSADLWSATSYQLLRKDALSCERWNRLHPEKEARVPYVVSALQKTKGPYVAVSDYMKAVPEMITRWVPGTYLPLGTDGYGMSDTREALRRHFEIDPEFIVLGVLSALQQDGKIEAATVARAIQDLGIDPEKIDPIAV